MRAPHAHQPRSTAGKLIFASRYVDERPSQTFVTRMPKGELAVLLLVGSIRAQEGERFDLDRALNAFGFLRESARVAELEQALVSARHQLIGVQAVPSNAEHRAHIRRAIDKADAALAGIEVAR